MMRPLAMMTLLWILFAGTVSAQTVTIRSGEHHRFSRLVLSIPNGTEWRLGRTEGGYRLDLGPAVGIISTASVFDRIPRSRIADLQVPEAGRLDIRLGCSCHADAFLWRPDRLVIDIVDGRPDPESPFEIALDPIGRPGRLTLSNPDQAILPLLFGPGEDAVPAAGSSLPLRMAAISGPAAPVTRPAPDPAEPADRPRVPIDAEGETRVAEAEAALLESLSRAASQGFVSIDLGVPQAGTERQPQVMPEPMPVDPGPEVAPDIAMSPGFTMRTALDQALSATPAPADCAPPGYFEPAAWADPEADFAIQVARARGSLTDEAGRVDPQAVENLARLYIHFGFGREALAILAEDGLRSTERMILGQLARIVDDEPLSDAPRWRGTGCSDGAALWAALAQGDPEGLSPADIAGLARAFQALPAPLRGVLGARVSAILTEAGEIGTADALLHSAEATIRDPLPGAPLAAAEIALESRGPEAAMEQLLAVVSPDARPTADEVLRLLTLAIDSGLPVPEGILPLAAALRFENRGTDMARALAIAEARVLIAQGASGDVLDLTESPDFRDPELAGQRHDLRSEAIGQLAGSLPTEAFLELAFGDLPMEASPDVANAIARRLIELGFGERASEVLRPPAQGEAMSERRYLRAEAAAISGRTAEVETHLGGLTDPRATAIRAMAGLTDAPLSPTQGVDEAEASAAAWRAGAWSRLDAAEDPLMRQAAIEALTPPTALTGETPLAERRAVLADSEATRALVDELLSQFTVESP